MSELHADRGKMRLLALGHCFTSWFSWSINSGITSLPGDPVRPAEGIVSNNRRERALTALGNGSELIEVSRQDVGSQFRTNARRRLTQLSLWKGTQSGRSLSKLSGNMGRVSERMGALIN